jgi:Zn-dependent M28 family amino/carboxypeptidase
MRAHRPILFCSLLAACAGGHESSLPNRVSSAPAATCVFPSAVPDGPPPPRARTILASVSAARLRADVDRLVGFGTRHTLSEARSETRGIGAARRWIEAELRAAAARAGRSGADAMTVEVESETLPADGKRIFAPVELVNLVATLPGSDPIRRSERYYVVGHYDSRATDVLDARSDAPGANDNASGTALVLELARVLAPHRFPATLVFLATAGEEQGLFGAKLHARRAKERGDRIAAVLNDDIVGDPSARAGAPHRNVVRVFSEGVSRAASSAELDEIRAASSEGDSPSRELARFVAEVARWEHLAVLPQLVARPDRFLRGGDHLPFNEAGFPAVRFTVAEEHFERQHEDVRTKDGVAFGDVAERVDAEYLADVARVNGAALVHLASAPSAPRDVRISTAKLENETTVVVAPSADRSVVHEVVVRATTSAVWERVFPMGSATRLTVPVSKDDVFVGARAVGSDGYRSPVTFARASRE